MEKKFLTVAPFECAWHDDLRFQEAGRGCVAFDAFAHNDVTVVFRENAGSQHYHYKRDNSPHYTVIIGSHKNKKLNIEVNGKKVVDVAGIDLQCSSTFQSYWISIYDGLISIGKGRYPFQHLVFQWLDSDPNRSVQYVGLSSWDRHVGYRNVNVLPLKENYITLWKHMDFGENNSNDDADEDLKEDFGQYENWRLGNFLESWELSDVLFIVGREKKAVPAHKVILAASGNFNFSSSEKDFIHLEDICYPILHALLRYIYIGHTEVPESYLTSLKDLSLKFDVITLVKLCEETVERCKLNKKNCNSGKSVELSYPNVQLHSCSVFLNRLPIDIKRLSKFQATLKYSDVEIYIEGHGLVAHSHRIIMSIWSVPFTKMFTNGMSESVSSKVYLKDVCFEAFTIMLNFMYTGEVHNVGKKSIDTLLLQLILLADQFGVSLLCQECCKKLLDHLSEDSVCPILQVISSISSCKLLEETCERIFSTHFDYCTTASTDFVLLEETTFLNILQHPDLTVTSEERVLDAILVWCMQSEELITWERMGELMSNSTLEIVFGQRLDTLITFLSFVRFPLLPYEVLQKLEETILSTQIPAFNGLVQEAITFLECGLPGAEKDLKFQHRRSSYKELRYICDGDSNGVLYYAGTSYGEHGWVNPVLAKTVSISSSSPLSRFTDPKALVSRTYQGTCFAGPRVENGRNTAWWMVDIGHGHQLMCNTYTLRQDGSKAFIRNWKFQGSMDGSNWTNLRVHENDETMCKPAQFASWPIFSPNALLPFRFFRVIVTAPTTDAASPWSFSICFLELYGFFR